VHAPETQVWFVQADAVPHVPLARQVCTPLPLHCLLPGTHTPVHAPDTQAELTQAEAVPQVPFD
jgi:hypothetical protein